MNSVVGRSSLVVGKTDVPSETNPVSNGVRAIVALTACVTAVIGIPILAFLPATISAPSIAGVLLTTRFPRQAKYLMWLGAAVTSLWVIPFCGGILRISLTAAGTDPKVIMAVAVSVALVVACDLALIAEALGQRRTTDDERRS